ncbi:MAG TPA: hypothetical protein VFJ19_09295 [Nocardioidaceae bacterium]|nr:hypothetical protein [Nocardioidaceae bacterium]
MSRRLIGEVVRQLVTETQRKTPTLTKRLVIVTAVTGSPRRCTYKLDAADEGTYPPAACLDSYTVGTLPQTCVALIDGGDVLILGATG